MTYQVSITRMFKFIINADSPEEAIKQTQLFHQPGDTIEVLPIETSSLPQAWDPED